jgi:GMP synthase (glutamine-hydrolysing)
VLVLRHDADAGPGYLGDALKRAGMAMVVVDVAAGDDLPKESRWAGVVSLGGSMGAYEQGRHPWLAAEKHLLAGAVELGIPTLGICLGCQLLADALGGRAYPGSGRELGSLRPVLTPEGRADPVIRHLDGPVPVSHADTWDLPPQAVLLAVSDRYRQAFRLGSALGVQPHPEAAPEAFARWVREKPPEALRREGIDPEAAIAGVRANAAAQRTVARRLFGAWAAEAGASASHGRAIRSPR